MTCAICSGPMELRYRGALTRPDAERLSPTNHTPGEYGDLYACTRCGTVHQPVLPEGDELYGLYRQMHDEHYLDEEAGRRRTARRLLDLIETEAGAPRAAGKSGRLLDVGCGPGLLLDEAARRGYEVTGLELSDASASHARDTLGLDVHQVPLTAYDPPSSLAGPRRPGSAETPDDDSSSCGYDVVVLADVIEHLDDVGEGLDRCRDLLRPGGVLCVVTPDPSSRTAQVAGAHWWGYVPAHTYLLPRRTLRRLLTDRGLALLADVSLVRTFSLRYWLAGFGGRGGPMGKLAGAVERVVPERVFLSLSLFDERVMVAQRSALSLSSSNGAAPVGAQAGAR